MKYITITSAIEFESEDERLDMVGESIQTLVNVLEDLAANSVGEEYSKYQVLLNEIWHNFKYLEPCYIF